MTNSSLMLYNRVAEDIEEIMVNFGLNREEAFQLALLTYIKEMGIKRR